MMRREPIRIIYAKLTSTGAYDVVAKTANIELNAARTLAEKLLPGNVPHGATIEEEVGYVHPPEGGHLVFRYARYGWSGDNRGEIYMTDILWLDDADFARARANAFALVPRSDAVFDVLTELPPPQIPERTAADDAARLVALAPLANDTAPIVANTLAMAPALLLETNERAAKAELFTLLLPPSLRPSLTFQTRAFRVPPFPPRLTLTDSYYASLQSGPWKKVLPDISVDVPSSLARSLTDLAAKPERLQRAHALYDKLPERTKDLRAETTRLAALAEFVGVLERGDVTEADAVLQLLDRGEAGHKLALAVLRGSKELLPAVADRVVESNALPQRELLQLLLERLAAAGDVNRLVRLLALDRRAVARMLPDFTDRAQPAVVAYLDALRRSGSGGRALSHASQLAQATAALAPVVDDAAAQATLSGICRETIHSAIEKAEISPETINELVALSVTADQVLQQGRKLQSAVPQLLSDVQLAKLGDASALASALESYPAHSIGALAGALLVRAVRTSQAQSAPVVAPEKLVLAARVALGQLKGPEQKQVRAALEQLGIRHHMLVELPAADQLLPLLGHDLQQAALTQQLVAAVARLSDTDGDAVGALAAAVARARRASIRLTRTHDSVEPLRSALTAVALRRRLGNNEEWPELELTLDLLAAISDGEANELFEDAALGKGGLLIRLRRLDRAIMQCNAATDPEEYERLASAIESPGTPLSNDMRQRLRQALGTRGLERRFTRLIAGVMDTDAQ